MASALLFLAASAALSAPGQSFSIHPPLHPSPASAVPGHVTLFMVAQQVDIQSTPDQEGADADAVQVAVDRFVSTLQSSLDDGSFESFALKGPAAPRKRRRQGKGKDGSDADAEARLERERERLRGKFKTITGRLVMLQEKKRRAPRGKKRKPQVDDIESSDDDGSLHVQATIKYHLATDVAKNWRVKRDADSEQSEVETGLRQLFLTAMGGDTDGANGEAPLSEWGAQNMNGEMGLLAGELVTSSAVYKLQLQPHHKAGLKLSKMKATQKDAMEQTRDLSALSHDRSKNHFLSPSSPFLQKLGVSNADGKPVNGMASKLRQCQKFVEVCGNLVDGSSAASASKIRVIDMGCGRGYLTFSLHSYLCDKFGATKETISVETRGIDRRPKLIEEINGISRDLGGEFSTLKFVEGTIGETNEGVVGTDGWHPSGEGEDSLDILIALHACDTATDDALWFAIGRNADIIVTAPCCQHELRPQIDHHATDNPDHPLGDILRHVIYRERSTEIVTDGMRAILLEIAGYTTQVFEFIGGEHTAKNVMIAATKDRKRRSEREQEEWLENRRRKLVELAQFYGITRQRLALLMGESISAGDDDREKRMRRNLSGMAPLEL